MTRCDEVREKLPDYLYELLPQWQMEEIAAHTKDCPECHEACEAAADDFRALDAWEVPGPGTDTCPEFMRKLRRHQALALAPQPAPPGVLRHPWSSALVRLPGMIRRWRAMPTGAKIAVTSVSLAAVAALAFALVALSSRWSGSAQAQPKVIEGVPTIGWESGKTSYYIAALHACLQVMGSPIRYEELMVASGAAFCTGWSPGSYQYDSRVAAPEDLVVNGAVAAGAMAPPSRGTRSCRSPPSAARVAGRTSSSSSGTIRPPGCRSWTGGSSYRGSPASPTGRASRSSCWAIRSCSDWAPTMSGRRP